MKNLYKFIIPTLVIVLVIFILFSIPYSRSIDSNLLSVENNLIKHKTTPKYHFYVILHDSGEPYLADLLKGLTETASAYKVALEINYTNNVDDYQDTIKLLNLAIAAKVDGIITHAYDTPEFAGLIQEADKRKIPVVTLEAGVPQSKSVSYVGINDFELGSKAGKLVVDATKGQAKVAIITDDIQGYGNIRVAGFKDAVKDYKNIEIETIKTSDSSILGANNLAQKILNSYKDINAIVCTSSKDTIGVSQSVVDLNKVGNVSIIGYDSTPEILNYIQKGVVYGTIVPNSYTIGSKSIGLLIDIKENGRASSYLDTDSNVVTKSNLNDYIKKNDSERGKSNK